MAGKCPPNLVLFVPDEWRGDALGHAGHGAVPTPVLDGLVEHEAVSFLRAFAQNPVSTPSRCSFMSGWYPHVHGHRTMYYMLDDDEPNLLKVLKRNGYRVFWGGKNDLVPADAPLDAIADVRFRPEREVALSPGPPNAVWRGEMGDPRFYSFYQGRLGEPGTPWLDKDRAVIEAAIDFVRQASNDVPWACYLSLIHPHPPYGVEEPWYSLVPRTGLPQRAPTPDFVSKPSMLAWIHARQGLSGWTEPEWDELRAVYYGMCARLDYLLGTLVAALRECSAYDETALVFFADHGDFVGDYGLTEKTQNTFEDCLTRVPLVIKPPKGAAVTPGVRSQLVELVDIPATVGDLLGIAWPYPGFGRSLAPLLRDPDCPHRDAVFAEGGRLHGETQCMELQSVGGQTPEGLYWPRLSAQRSEGPEHTKAIMCRTVHYKYVYRHYEQDELYDLDADPMELQNRIDDPDLMPVAADLRARIFRWLVETTDAVPFEADPRE